jgi:hypothetical protein
MASNVPYHAAAVLVWILPGEKPDSIHLSVTEPPRGQSFLQRVLLFWNIF